MTCLMYLDGSHAKTPKNVRVYMRTAQTGLFQSVWVNSVFFRAKQLGERSFSLVMICLMWWDGSHAKTSKNASVYMRTARTGLVQRVWVNSVLFHAKRLGEPSFSLVMMTLMYLDGSHAKTSRNSRVYMRTAQTGLFWRVWVNSVLFHEKRLRSRSFSLILVSLM